MGSSNDAFEVTEFVLGNASTFTKLKGIRDQLAKLMHSKCRGHLKYNDEGEKTMHFVAHKDGRRVSLSVTDDITPYVLEERRGKLFVTIPS